jgi:hypothetical protein
METSRCLPLSYLERRVQRFLITRTKHGNDAFPDVVKLTLKPLPHGCSTLLRYAHHDHRNLPRTPKELSVPETLVLLQYNNSRAGKNTQVLVFGRISNSAGLQPKVWLLVVLLQEPQ